MLTIDADTHVIETEHTWDYMDDSESQFRPILISPQGGKGYYWLIDGRIFSTRTNINRHIPAATLEMRDIEARLKHMDELQVDIQVLYPSLFLRPLTSQPEVEAALCRSYNRWLAEIWKKGENRLRWVAVLPLMSMDQALAQARFGRENGACGLFMRGLVENKLLSDPYFFPLYEEANRLDMPICIHASTGNFDWVELFQRESGFSKFKLPVLSAFHSLVYDGIPEKFPRLRVGFIEVRAQWVPYVIVDLAKRFEQKGKCWSRDIMREYRLYVACQTDDDLPYVLKYSGEDNIIIGSDYGHADTSSEIEALRKLKQQGEMPQRVIDKILDDNPRAFYNL